MPDLPPDWALPARDVLLHSSCELQTALRELDHRTPPKVFNARNWSIRISLNPKVDADIAPGLGLTRRVPTRASAVRFSNWVLGGSNGATDEMRGERTGNLDFVFDSAELIDDNRLPCDPEKISAHSLTKSIGIEEWLVRVVDAAYVTGSTIDKPSFSSEVFMKFSGSGSYTYTFPPGTDLATLSGYYQLDEILNINLTAKPKVDKIQLVTLPVGGPGSHGNNSQAPVPSTTSVIIEQRSDLQQIEQAIRNLRPTTN